MKHSLVKGKRIFAKYMKISLSLQSDDNVAE
jgi:hypothetical protein